MGGWGGGLQGEPPFDCSQTGPGGHQLVQGAQTGPRGGGVVWALASPSQPTHPRSKRKCSLDNAFVEHRGGGGASLRLFLVVSLTSVRKPSLSLLMAPQLGMQGGEGGCKFLGESGISVPRGVHSPARADELYIGSLPDH